MFTSMPLAAIISVLDGASGESPPNNSVSLAEAGRPVPGPVAAGFARLRGKIEMGVPLSSFDRAISLPGPLFSSWPRTSRHPGTSCSRWGTRA